MSGGQAQKKQSFLQGVAVLTAATIIVKLLGFIYKVPLQNILQERGFGYFNSAYDVYNILLMTLILTLLLHTLITTLLTTTC